MKNKCIRSRDNSKAADFHPAASRIVQAKLKVGRINDSSEIEADRVADRVINMDSIPAISHPGPVIQRKCSACEHEELQRKTLGSFIQKADNASGTVASESITNSIHSKKGKGSPLDVKTKSFMETRFGSSFDSVKIHTGDESTRMNRELNSRAFTVGNDIFFNSQEYDPGTSKGKHLLAHELTHTIQQRAREENINRKLTVTAPATNIPNPTGKGLVQTNLDTVLNYLNQICAKGSISISAAGVVSIPTWFCTPTTYPPDFIGPVPTTVLTSGTPVGCGCICDLVKSKNDWVITVDDGSWPHTSFKDPVKSATPGSGGTGGEVTAHSPNSSKLWGAVNKSGGFQNIDPWLVLGHELCGHAWLGNTGNAGPDSAKPRGKGGHQQTVERENLLRDEHGITRRGTFRQPYCGESFWHPVGTSASAKTVSMSSFISNCEKWRIDYNKLNGTSYSVSDTIPVTLSEKLPP